MAEEPTHSTEAVDVVIVTYDSASTVADAIDSVRCDPAVRHIIAIDNASSDEGCETVRSHGVDALIENDTNLGFAAAVNIGLALCEAPYVLLLNPDARMNAEALDELVSSLNANGNAVIAGPLLRNKSDELNLGARRFSTPLNRTVPFVPLLRRWRSLGPEYSRRSLLARGEKVTHVDYVWGAAALCRRRFLQEIGGLDDAFFLYSEDEDLGRQARARGVDVLLVTSATVDHVGGVSSRHDRALEVARRAVANSHLLEKWMGQRSAKRYERSIRVAILLQRWACVLRGRADQAEWLKRTDALLKNMLAESQCSRTLWA